MGDRVRHKELHKDYIYKISEVHGNSYTLAGYSWVIQMAYQDNYELVPDKFDINTLKPFDKVLVRDGISAKWCIQFFERYDRDSKYQFICLGYKQHIQCIPYEGNEHLRGTNNDCAEFYKNWE